MLVRRSIPVKLALAVGIPVVASLLFALLALRTLQQVRIGGAQYDELSESNDLRADILPPPYYIVESYLTAQLLAETTDDATYQDLRQQMTQHELDYVAAHDRGGTGLDLNDAGQAEIARLQGLLESSYSAPVINLRPADDRRRMTGSEPAGQFAH